MKILAPDMPDAWALSPYLLDSHARHDFVNNGFYARRLEAQIGHMKGASAAVVSNGTLALELALRSLNLRPGAVVMVPALTFVGTAQAVVNAGLRPYIVDVDPTTKQLSPESMMSAAVACAVPVAVWGEPVSMKPWERPGCFTVVDAAGALTTQEVSQDSNIMTCFSMHATKFVGAYEGGAVCSSNFFWVQSVKDRANFGPGGTNAKMSEIHAATGLCSLSEPFLSAKRKKADALYAAYSAHLEMCPYVELPDPLQDRTLFNVGFVSKTHRNAVWTALSEAQIEAKVWYGPFLNRRAEFTEFLADDCGFHVTNHVADTTLGIPFHSFMTESDVEQVCDIIKRVRP